MSKEIAARPVVRGVLADMAERYGMVPEAFEATVRATCMPVVRGNVAQATREEFAAFLLVAKEHHLNPLTRQIFAFPAKGGGIVPIVPVDGWVELVNRHSACDGFEFGFQHDDKGKLISCTCTMYRKDRSRPIIVTEYLSECIRDTEPWKMQHRMLRHKAFIQSARYAFGFSGIYDEDEGAVIAEGREVVARQIVPPPAPAKERATPKVEVIEAKAEIVAKGAGSEDESSRSSGSAPTMSDDDAVEAGDEYDSEAATEEIIENYGFAASEEHLLHVAEVFAKDMDRLSMDQRRRVDDAIEEATNRIKRVAEATAKEAGSKADDNGERAPVDWSLKDFERRTFQTEAEYIAWVEAMMVNVTKETAREAVYAWKETVDARRALGMAKGTITKVVARLRDRLDEIDPPPTSEEVQAQQEATPKQNEGPAFASWADYVAEAEACMRDNTPQAAYDWWVGTKDDRDAIVPAPKPEEISLLKIRFVKAKNEQEYKEANG